ncbi:hypothetical protein AAHE18_19G172000 [Arachis hypogaea]
MSSSSSGSKNHGREARRDGGGARREHWQDASSGAHQALGAVMADDDDKLHGCRKHGSSTYRRRHGETRASEHTTQSEERGERRDAIRKHKMRRIGPEARRRR